MSGVVAHFWIIMAVWCLWTIRLASQSALRKWVFTTTPHYKKGEKSSSYTLHVSIQSLLRYMHTLRIRSPTTVVMYFLHEATLYNVLWEIALCKVCVRDRHIHDIVHVHTEQLTGLRNYKSYNCIQVRSGREINNNNNNNKSFILYLCDYTVCFKSILWLQWCQL